MPDLVHVLARIGQVHRRLLGHHRARFVLPLGRLDEPLLQVADAGEVLVEPLAIPRAHTPLQPLRLIRDRVHDAAAERQFARLCLDLLRRAAEEQPLEDLGRPVLAGNEHASRRPRQAACALRHVDAERERRITRQVPDTLGDVLVEGDAVAEAAARRMRRGRQEADVRRVAAIHIGVHDAAAHGEIVAEGAKLLQIGRQLVVAPCLTGFREELVRQHAEVIADAEKSPRRGRAGGMCEGRLHRLESGRPSRTPAPCRKWRRESAGCVDR